MPTQTTVNPYVRSAMRSMVRASAPRPAAARLAAKDFELPFGHAVIAEIRWAFTPPRTWLLGVVANFSIAMAWLVVQPLTPHGRHHDWVLIVSAYFSSFILADVTTTNLLGADHYRVLKCLADGTPPWRMLLVKNLALLTIIGVPTLIAATVFTLWQGHPSRLGEITPNVVVPILSWLGVGNVISVLIPVAAAPLIRRWRHRRNLRRIAVWVTALTLPYALYYVADPVGGIDSKLLWIKLPRAIGPVFGRDTKSFVHLAIALAVWVIGTVIADQLIRRRGLQVR